MKNAWRSHGAGAVLIILLTLVSYFPALRGGFIWDDDDYLTGNRTMRSVEGLREIWLNPAATVQYYPLTFTVFWVECHLWGLHPFGFHLVNVILQAANALLFWRLLSRLRVPGAWWAAAVFALHPVHVMSVAWITELKNVLSGFFYLAALLSYLRFCGLDRDPAITQPGRRWFYGLTVAMYLCALLSKSATSILPVAVLLIIWWKKGRIERKDLAPVLPLFLVGILSGVFTLWLERYEKGASGQEFVLSFASRFLVAGRAFWFCLGKLVWPTRLTFIYPRWSIDATAVWQYLFPLGAIALLAALWRAQRKVGRAPLAAMAYFSLAFPALVMVQVLYMMRYSFVADHWQYLGSMSVIPLGVGGAVVVWKWWKRPHQKLGVLIGALVLAALSILTWRQCESYRDLETLWRDTLAKNPGAWLAHNGLGAVLGDRGRLSEAIAEFEASLRIKPDNEEALKDLGGALVRMGRVREAIGPWEELVHLKPRSAGAHNDLGTALMQAGRLDEAIRHYEQALQLKPDYVEAHDNLGAALLQEGRSKEALFHFEQALQLKPDYAEAHFNLGMLLEQQGRVREAIEHYEEALRIKPEYAEAHNNLGSTLARTGKIDEAVGHWERALQIKPNYAEAHNNFGIALLRQGRTQEALVHFERALQLNPDDADAHFNLGVLLEQQGRVPEAIEHYEQALRIKPGMSEAGNGLARLRTSR